MLAQRLTRHAGAFADGQFAFHRCEDEPTYWSGIARETYYLDARPLKDRFLDAMVRHGMGRPRAEMGRNG